MAHPLLFTLVAFLGIGQTPQPSVPIFSFKNETLIPVVVQVKSIFNGQLLRDRPYLIKPGETSPLIQIPGMKSVSISEVTNPRPLIQLPIPQSNEEVILAIIGTDKSLRIELRKPSK